MTDSVGSILITGASGHLGRVVSQSAERASLPTVLWSHHPVPSLGRGPQVHGDITSTADVDRIVSDARVQTVIHLAAVTGPRCEQDAEAAHAINVTATLRLAEAAAQAGATRFVFASTAAVYGDAFDRPIVETDALQGTSNYAATKMAAEAGLAAIGTRWGIDVVALRIFNIYGHGFVDSLIHRLQNASASAPVTLRGTVDFVRDYVDANDVAAACLAACAAPMPAPCTAINVGSGVATSNADLVAAVDPLRRDFVTVEPGKPSHSWADVSRMTDILAVTARPLGARL